MNMNYREAQRILQKQKEAQETINRFKGLETFGSRIGYASNKELIIDLLEMETDENIKEIISRYSYLLKSDKKAELSPGKVIVIKEENASGKSAEKIAEELKVSVEEVKTVLAS